ncbi:hypothetical protein JQN72_12560 [Phycicoccus sp. CSK15P-2]|uniref:hypothetical protein n=1 Tax=Phycicoccus sp. CSK15P-2 TaxID=2807627 RepID=UPI00194DBCE2|nr:hypothetical protein [Phycicoccus sp. CSK15P-2]MBM6403611.1 hypothetical protein [Phycicoccus sp. CSK15P-2]MBM6405076.1 hypothetical protein [Phycicoccus sp. CSK15P-2]
MARRDAEAADEAEEFAELAAAHGGPALRLALLVTRSPAVAEGVVRHALVGLAGHWGEARESGPAHWLRSEVVRRAVAEALSVPPADGAEAGAAAPDPDDPDVAVRMTLDRLPPEQRVVLGLSLLEDRTDHEVAAVVGRPLETVRADRVTAAAAMTAALTAALAAGPEDLSEAELRDRLESAVPEPVAPGLVQEAWESAVTRRRTARRRVVVAGGAALAWGALTWVLARERPGGPRPEPSHRPSDGRLSSVALAGATVHLAPAPEDEVDLPAYPDAASLALPARLGPGTARPLPILSPAGSQASVRAVYLVRVGEDRYQPALLLPRQSPQPQVVAMAPLRPTEDPAGNVSVALGPRTVDADRHRLVFAQPGAVVVLEVRSARARRIAVPDDALSEAGWATDGRTVIARSARSGWLVDSRTEDVRRAGNPVNPGWADIRVTSGAAFVQRFSGSGRLVEVRRMEGPAFDAYGPSVSNTEGWACCAGFFASAPEVQGRGQGLVAVQGDLRPLPRILAAPAADAVPPAAYRPLAWGPRDTVLLESRSTDPAGGGPVVRVLAWDVIGGRMAFVADVDPPAPEGAAFEQGFSGAWSL